MSQPDLPPPYDPTGVTDPGWRAALPIGSRPAAGSAPILVARRVFTTFISAIILLGVVLAFTLPVAPDGDVPVVAWVLVAAALPAAGIGVVIGRRPLTPDRASVGGVMTRMFIGVALVESLALLGFVAAFLAEAMLPYLLAAPLSLLGFALIAPSDARLRADDLALQRQGIATSVREQAYGSPPPPG